MLKRARSAVSGLFVKKSYAKDHPETTVEEVPNSHRVALIIDQAMVVCDTYGDPRQIEKLRDLLNPYR